MRELKIKVEEEEEEENKKKCRNPMGYLIFE